MVCEVKLSQRQKHVVTSFQCTPQKAKSLINNGIYIIREQDLHRGPRYARVYSIRYFIISVNVFLLCWLY